MTYRLFNLTIDSEIPLPLLLRSQVSGHADLIFRENTVPRRLTSPCFEGPGYQVGDREFIFEVYGVARYWGQNGHTVLIERAPAAKDEQIALFLLGTVFGALLQQRGVFLLHAGAVSHETGALLIAGESGSGKSTLTAALVQEGYNLISDDTCLLTKERGRVLVHPGHPHIRLWRDSLKLLGIATEGLQQVMPEMDKYYWPVAESFAGVPLPVAAFFELVSGGSDYHCNALRLKGIDRILALTKNTYRIEALEYIATQAQCLDYWKIMTESFPQYRLAVAAGDYSLSGNRPRVDAVLNLVKEDRP